MVLLENRDKALPFSEGIKQVAVFGNTSYRVVAGGTGSGDVNEAYTVSLEEGLENAGYQLDAALKQLYVDYLNAEEGVWSCTSVGYCSEVCPKHVDPSAALLLGKKMSATDYVIRMFKPE